MTMPIRASCQCGQRFQANDSLAGKTVRCPQCSRPLTIPGAATPVPADPVATAAQASASEQAGETSIADLLDAEGIGSGGSATLDAAGKRCPSCNALMAAEAVLCVACGYHLEEGRRLETKRSPRQVPINPYASPEIDPDDDKYHYPGRGRRGRRRSDSPDGRRTGPPWEKYGGGVDVFFETVKLTVFSPVRMFSTMQLDGGLAPPVTFCYCGYLLIAGVFVALAFLALTMLLGPFALLAAPWMLAWMFGYTIAIFIVIPIALLLQSLIAHVAVILTGEFRARFETTFRVVGYCYGTALVVSIVAVFVLFCAVLAGVPMHAAEMLPLSAYAIDILLMSFGFAYAHEIGLGKGMLAAVLMNIAMLFIHVAAIDWITQILLQEMPAA